MTATLLTVAEFREHIETALVDDAVQRLLDSAEADINDWCGRLTIGEYEAAEDITEWHVLEDGTTTLWLKQPAASITTVTEYWPASDLSDDTEVLLEDENFWVDGNVLRRKDGHTWNRRTKVVYAPESTVARRRAVMIQLVKLEINADPGTSFEGAGSWQHTTQDYELVRQHLLWSLCPPPVFA